MPTSTKGDHLHTIPLKQVEVRSDEVMRLEGKRRVLGSVMSVFGEFLSIVYREVMTDVTPPDGILPLFSLSGTFLTRQIVEDFRVLYELLIHLPAVQLSRDILCSSKRRGGEWLWSMCDVSISRPAPCRLS